MAAEERNSSASLHDVPGGEPAARRALRRAGNSATSGLQPDPPLDVNGLLSGFTGVGSRPYSSKAMARSRCAWCRTSSRAGRRREGYLRKQASDRELGSGRLGSAVPSILGRIRGGQAAIGPKRSGAETPWPPGGTVRSWG
jgi:hypothetical protein